MFIHMDLGQWIDFYTTKKRSKDSDAWRQLRGHDAASREWTVREYYHKALAGELTKKDRTWHEVLACRGQEG